MKLNPFKHFFFGKSRRYFEQVGLVKDILWYFGYIKGGDYYSVLSVSDYSAFQLFLEGYQAHALSKFVSEVVSS